MKIKKKLIPYIVIAVLHAIYSLSIPLNILPGAPHDDTLFYNLGYNIAHFRWLGDFSAVSHIKGPIYPLFLAFSIFFHIPLRMLESFFISLTSYYAVKILIKLNFNSKLVILVFALIIFYPFQYGLIDYRLLRDMIYPQICLIIFVSLAHIYISIKNANAIPKTHSLIFGLFLFLYINTREETIWIVPSLGLAIFLICFNLRSKYLLLIKTLSQSLLIFLVFSLSISLLNYFKYGSYVNNIFKDGAFQKGYGALFRINREKLLLDTVSRKDFETLFVISPTLARLKDFVYSDQYEGWIGTACYAQESQGKDIQKDSSCPNEMPAAFLLFALMDGLKAIGLNNQHQMVSFMGAVSDEIEMGCNQKIIDCISSPPGNMPPALMNFQFSRESLYAKLHQSIDIVLNYEPPPFSSITPPPDLNGILQIRRKLNVLIIPMPRQIVGKPVLMNVSNHYSEKIIGWVDGISRTPDGFELYGWAINGLDKVDRIVVFDEKNQQLCSIKPNINRKDISPNSPKEIGFRCSIKYLVKDETIKIKVYGYDLKDDTYYKIGFVDFISATLGNKYDENCYLKYNEDVSDAVRAKKITGKDHWYNFGATEGRKCAPFNKSFDHQLEKIKFYAISHNFIFEFLINTYHSVLSNSLPAICIALLLMIFWRNLTHSSLMLVLISLIISRVVLISLLDVVGMAPVSGLYLASAVYLFFVLSIFCYSYIINLIFNCAKKPGY